MAKRNEDPRTRYEVRLDCGHTAVTAYPPVAPKTVCRECGPVGELRPWLSYIDTRLDLHVVQAPPAT